MTQKISKVEKGEIAKDTIFVNADIEEQYAFVFKVEKGWAVFYDDIQYGGDWKRVWIGEDYIVYITKEGEVEAISYEDLKKTKKRLDK